MCDIYTVRQEGLTLLFNCVLKKGKTICLGEMLVNHKLESATCFPKTRCSGRSILLEAPWVTSTSLPRCLIALSGGRHQEALFTGGSSTVYLDVLFLNLHFQGLATNLGFFPLIWETERICQAFKVPSLRTSGNHFESQFEALFINF